jgi:hypothetical protein
MRLPIGVDGGAMGLRLAGWLFGTRDPAATRERDGRFAGALFLLTAGYGAVVAPSVGFPAQRGVQVGLLAICAVSGAVCFAVPWRDLPGWAVQVPTAWLVLLLSFGAGFVGGVLGAYAIGYVLLFIYVGLTTSPLMTLRVVVLTEVGVAVAGAVGNQRSGLVVLAASIVVSGIAGQLVSMACSWNRTASLRLDRVNRALVDLAAVESEADATRRIAELVRRLVGADAAVVLLPEHTGSATYVRRGGYAPPQGAPEIRIDTAAEQCGLGIVMRTGTPLYLPDAESSPIESRWLVAELAMASALYLPLTGDGGTAGAVLAWWTEPRRLVDPLGQQLAELVTVPAGQALGRLRQANRLDSPAMRDPLTGVGNRQRFDAALTDLPVGGTVLLFDFDAFAAVNDMYGRRPATTPARLHTLRRSARQNDVVTGSATTRSPWCWPTPARSPPASSSSASSGRGARRRAAGSRWGSPSAPPRRLRRRRCRAPQPTCAPPSGSRSADRRRQAVLVRASSGMVRSVLRWYSAKPGIRSVTMAHSVSRSSPVSSVTSTGNVSVPTSTVIFGLALRLWYQAGCSGAPPFDATMIMRSPSGKYTSGLILVWPVRAPT